MGKTISELLEQAAVFRYHKALIQEHGTGTTGALGWMRPEGQLARFEVLASIADLTDRSVLDAGCGHADLYPFLKARFRRLRYYGVEQIPELLDVAAARYGDETDAAFFTGDFLEAGLPFTDYIMACGALSYRHEDPLFIYKAIQKLFDSCRLGLAFNLLSEDPVAGGLLTGYEPQGILDFCRRLTRKVRLVTGYHKADFTVLMQHE